MSRDESFSCSNWFHGKLSRESAEKVLKEGKNQSFFINNKR